MGIVVNKQIENIYKKPSALINTYTVKTHLQYNKVIREQPTDWSQKDTGKQSDPSRSL